MRLLKGAHRRHWILLGILLGLLALKSQFDPYPVGDFGRDGSYYYQVARHVAEGDGLATSVALYHQGYERLPHPSPVYPLWPLVLGAAGAMIGLERAASLLPEILYFAALILLYALANAVARSWGSHAERVFPRSGLLLVGHLAALLLGTNAVFFRYTSLPFTEGLAFSLAFASVLSLARAGEGSCVRWGAASGALAAFAFLTRSQFLGLIPASVACLLLVGVREPTYRRAAAAAAASAAVPILIWTAYLWTSFANFSPRMLVDFTAAHETRELDAYTWIVQTDSLWAWLVDRAAGFRVAFDPGGASSYVASFGLVVYVVPLALLWLILRPSMLRAVPRELTSGGSLAVTGALAAGIACIAPVHALHAGHPHPSVWLFHFRHGLPIAIPIVVALAFVFATGRLPLRGLALLLVGASLWTSAAGIRGELARAPRYHGPLPAEEQLAAWIEEQEQPLLFATTRPWSLGALTRGLFHHVSCKDRPSQLLTYFDRLNVDYLILPDSDRSCRFLKTSAYELMPIRRFGRGQAIAVYDIRHPGLAGQGDIDAIRP
jgi:hypothetical protein